MGWHSKRVCAVCGQETDSGWSIHCSYKNHNTKKEKLKVGEYPLQPKHADWFGKLSP